jgi:hypothetical protein
MLVEFTPDDDRTTVYVNALQVASVEQFSAHPETGAAIFFSDPMNRVEVKEDVRTVSTRINNALLKLYTEQARYH